MILTPANSRPGLLASIGRGLLFWLIALAAGCAHGQGNASPPAPPVIASTTHYLGTPLSGAKADPAPATLAPGDAWAVQVTIVSLDRMPAGGESLSGKSMLVTATRGASAVLPSSRLTRGARIALLPNPTAFAAVFGSVGQPTILLNARGAVPIGATAVFKAAEQLPRDDSGTGRIWRRGVEVDVFRPRAAAKGQAPDKSIEVALAVDDFAQPDRVDSSAETPAGPAPAPSPQHEMAVVDIPLAPNPQTLALAVPFQFGGWKGQAVAAIVTISPGSSDPAHLQAVAKCLADLKVSSAIAAARPRVGLPDGDEGSALRVATAALNDPARRRSAMIYLAGVTGASLCADAALVADDTVLARVAGEVYNKASADPPDEGAMGWLLDQTWLLDMGELLGTAKLSPELSAVLATHAGEVGRHPSSIEEVGKAAHSHADFQSLLIAENTIFLEDGSPSARARAFDWLQAHGKAPGGYGPLDPPRQRREALERFALGLPPATAPATAPSTEPTTEPAEVTTAPSTEPATEPSATTTPTTGPATEPAVTTTPTTGPATEPAVTTPSPATEPAAATSPTTVPLTPATTSPNTQATEPVSMPTTAPATQAATYVPEPGPPTVWQSVARQPTSARTAATTQPTPPLTLPSAITAPTTRTTGTIAGPILAPATQAATFVPEPGPPTIWQTVARHPTTARTSPSTQPTTPTSQEAPHE